MCFHFSDSRSGELAFAAISFHTQLRALRLKPPWNHAPHSALSSEALPTEELRIPHSALILPPFAFSPFRVLNLLRL
jgi:hypothetical protein